MHGTKKHKEENIKSNAITGLDRPCGIQEVEGPTF